MVEPTNLPTVLSFVLGGLAIAIGCTFFNGRRRTVRGARLPPGPAPLPFVGSALKIDALRPWLTYATWAERYGDIFMVQVMKRNIIVISSEKVAKDILERRSGIYSDRPYLATREPYGLSYNVTWTPYSDCWRSQRRLFHQTFRAENSATFHPLQLQKAHKLILDILGSPTDYATHIHRFSAGMMMAVVYDYEIAPNHDDLVELMERGSTLVVENMKPEIAAIIDAFPFVLRLPEWFPGGGFGERARTITHWHNKMISEPFKHAEKQEAEGSTSSAMALELLRNTRCTGDASLLEVGKGVCATAVGAGLETTTSTLLCFVFAMVCHPEAQERAQAEIEAVVGTDRFPNFDDRPNLPYVEAVLKETLRLYPVVPLGIPHATTTDDVYNGMFIPKGSTIVANIWAMSRDPEIYPEPDAFKPERFLVDGRLKEGEKTDNSITFGFGRRICPGRHTADSSVWIVIVSILATMTITKALDDKGNELDIGPEWASGITTYPRAFPCTLKSRRSDIDAEKLLKADLLI